VLTLESLHLGRLVMGSTKHAAVRAQQRGIPPLIDQWLDAFGEEHHQGNGFVRIYFSRKSIREMERCFGKKPIQLMERYLYAYKIEKCDSGMTITTGWVTSRIRR